MSLPNTSVTMETQRLYSQEKKEKKIDELCFPVTDSWWWVDKPHEIIHC